jgi:hypothetical protein
MSVLFSIFWLVITLSLGFSSAFAQNIRLSPEDSLDTVRPIEARYFRMTALRTAHDNNVASAADVSVLLK